MAHPFSELQAEYAADLAAMRVTNAALIESVARKLVGWQDRYRSVAVRTRVPVAFIAALHYRESSGNFRTYLGNGEPLTRITRLVPKGRGPWADWEEGAIDALRFAGLDKVSAPWALPYCCWKGEAWNGFGPRAHGRRSGYLWAGTNIYTGGKYVADGVWSSTTKDQQPGIMPLIVRMGTLDAGLHIGDLSVIPAPSIIPVPGPVPGWVDNALVVQQAMNRLGYGPLREDGSYGRITREAVRSFQQDHGLTDDGLAGPKTMAKIEAALKAITEGVT